jgi:hypothetical protein
MIGDRRAIFDDIFESILYYDLYALPHFVTINRSPIIAIKKISTMMLVRGKVFHSLFVGCYPFVNPFVKQ